MLFVGLDLLPFSVDYKNQQPCSAHKHIIYLTIVPEQKWAFKRIPYKQQLEFHPIWSLPGL